MDLSNTPVPATRHDGWTAARKVQFLEALAHDGNVRAACARVGLSREAAYRLRRRDPLFARAWAAAQLQARDIVGDVLGTRAIEGIEEEIWHRGEVVGTRRRHDTRLLLAHMARLDKLAEDAAAAGDATAVKDAERFDELLACVAGESVPEDLAVDPGELPIDRETAGEMFADLAEERAPKTECDEARRRGRAEGEALWDAWHEAACRSVDRLLAAGPGTLSTVSTSTAVDAGQAAPSGPDGA